MNEEIFSMIVILYIQTMNLGRYGNEVEIAIQLTSAKFLVV